MAIRGQGFPHHAKADAAPAVTAEQSPGNAVDQLMNGNHCDKEEKENEKVRAAKGENCVPFEKIKDESQRGDRTGG